MNTNKRGWKTARAAFARRLTSLALAVVMLWGLFPGLTPAAEAAEWMEPYLEKLVEWGVMRGSSSGNLNPDRVLTRAEFVTMINRAFGYTERGSTPFQDVPANAWYADDINIAYQAGYFTGTSETTAGPLGRVTREQAAVLLGRNLRLQGIPGVNSDFTDVQRMGNWSRGMVQECAELGIIQGYADGTFRPQNYITRGQMACFLVRALGTLVHETGDQIVGGVYGNLTVNTSGVKLKDTVVTGNLYLSGGVGLGNVELENVTVMGKIVVCGAGEAERGESSIILRNVTAEALEIDSLSDHFMTVRTEGLTNIANTIVRTSAYLEDVTDDDQGLRLITLDGTADGTQLQLAGNIKEVVNITPNSNLQVVQGITHTLTVDERATGSALSIANDTSVKILNLDAGTPVTGNGDVEKMNVNAAGSTATMLPDSIFIRPGIESNIHNQVMDNIAAEESSDEPRLLAGYPLARNLASTSADGVFSTNKRGTLYWAVSTLLDGSVGEDELRNPSAYPGKVLRSGTINVTASKTEMTARLTGLSREGSYYISAMLVDERGHTSPVKVTAFTTTDDSVPAFATGYPEAILTVDPKDEEEQIIQARVMATKTCKLYYALLPKNSTAPTADALRSGAVAGNLGYGVMELTKNRSYLISRVNTAHLAEETTYDLYFWLNDADNGKSSAVRRIQVTTKDMTPPVVTNIYQSKSDRTSAQITFTMSERADLFWVAVKAGETLLRPTVTGDVIDPTDLAAKIQVEAGGGNAAVVSSGRTTAAQADTNYTFTVNRLQEQGVYDLYYVAKDPAGNYSEAVKILENVMTSDATPPAVEVEFSRFNEGANGVINPWVDSDVTLVFNEIVRGTFKDGSMDRYDDFYTLYEKVRDTVGNDLEHKQAKDALAVALRRYIRLYPGTPPASGNPRQDPVTDNDGTLSTEELASLPAWIDYREAVVSRVDGRVKITFPGGTGIKMQSGGTYFFRVESVVDASGNMIRPNPTYVPKGGFTTLFATVDLLTANTVSIDKGDLQTPGDFPDDKNVEGNALRVGWSFTVTPNSTKQVSDDIGWDMLLWSDTKLEFTLYCRSRPRSGSGSATWSKWEKVGVGDKVPVDKSDNSESVYVSLTRSTYLNNSTVYPHLNTLDQDTVYEYAIHLVSVGDNDNPNAWISEITLGATIMAGGTTAMNQSSLVYQGNNTTLEAGKAAGAISIGDPDPFNYTIAPEEREGPALNEGYPLITNGDTLANITVSLDRVGTAYFMAVPLTPTAADGTITQDNYSAPIGIAIKENTTDVELPEIEKVPTNGRDTSGKYENPMLRLPAASTVATRTTEAGIVWEEREYPQKDLAGMVTLKGLVPNTTYLLLIATKGVTRYSQYVYCYTFTTSEVEAPKLELQANGSEALVRTDLDSEVRGLLIVDGSDSDLRKPFSITAGTATSDDYANRAGTATDGKFSVLDALIESYGTGNGIRNSVFDQYATLGTKELIFSKIESSTISPNSTVDVVERFSVSGGTTWKPVREFQNMESGRWYCFLAYAESPLGSDRAYRAVRPLQIADTQPPTVTQDSVTATFAKQTDGTYKGQVTITFSEDLYFQSTEGGIQSIKPVTSTALSAGTVTGNWVSRTFISGNRPLGWEVYTESGAPRNTNQMVFYTTGPVTAGDYTFAIREGLCDEWGNRPTGTNSGFQVVVRIRGNDTDGYTYTVSGIPDGWLGR